MTRIFSTRLLRNHSGRWGQCPHVPPWGARPFSTAWAFAQAVLQCQQNAD